MISTLILDASALIAIALHEPGGDAVLEHIEKSGAGVLLHAVNAFEVVAKLRERGLSENDAWNAVQMNRIRRVTEIDDEMILLATNLKHQSPHLSMGDCFCLALAEYFEGTCLTSDSGFSTAKTTATVMLFR